MGWYVYGGEVGLLWGWLGLFSMSRMWKDLPQQQWQQLKHRNWVREKKKKKNPLRQSGLAPEWCCDTARVFSTIEKQHILIQSSKRQKVLRFQGQANDGLNYSAWTRDSHLIAIYLKYYLRYNYVLCMQKDLAGVTITSCHGSLNKKGL